MTKMSKSVSKLVYFQLPLAVLVVIIFALITEHISAKPKGPAMGLPPTEVTVTQATLVNWQPNIQATGTLVAPQGLTVASEIDGRITNIYFHSGQTVNAGDPLVQLNPDIIAAQLKQYQAELKMYELAYDRAKDLTKKSIVSSQDYDLAESNYKTAQAKMEQAQAQLQQTLIRAPFAGRLGLRRVSIGDYVTAGHNLVTLQSVDPLFVDFNIPEEDLSKIKKDQTVTLTTPTYPNEKFSGQLYAFESLIDVGTRTLQARGRLSNKDGKLIPGSFVEVKLFLGQPESLISIPQVSLITAEDGEAVFVIKNNQAVLTPVKVAKRRRKDVLIRSGLQAGDLVVTAGQIKLFDKAPVVVSNPPASTTAAKTQQNTKDQPATTKPKT